MRSGRPQVVRIQANSVEPPPMSNSNARRPSNGSSGAQDSSASSASSRLLMMPKSKPVSCFTRPRNSTPLVARRQASVAIARTRRTGRRARRLAQACNARIARSIASWLRRPVLCRPSPSRTILEKLSRTRNPWPAGVPMSMRQLLVPRSRAANAGPNTRRGSSSRESVHRAAGSSAGAACTGVILTVSSGWSGRASTECDYCPLCRFFHPNAPEPGGTGPGCDTLQPPPPRHLMS